jgi:hypothetical protein
MTFCEAVKIEAGLLSARLIQVKLKSLEAISKPRLRPDRFVTSFFKMLTYSKCMLRFFIGLRLAPRPDPRF